MKFTFKTLEHARETMTLTISPDWPEGQVPEIKQLVIDAAFGFRDASESKNFGPGNPLRIAINPEFGDFRQLVLAAVAWQWGKKANQLLLYHGDNQKRQDFVCGDTVLVNDWLRQAGLNPLHLPATAKKLTGVGGYFAKAYDIMIAQRHLAPIVCSPQHADPILAAFAWLAGALHPRAPFSLSRGVCDVLLGGPNELEFGSTSVSTAARSEQ